MPDVLTLLPTVSEPVLRLSIFAGVFVFLAALEWFVPRRRLRTGRSSRWPTNLVLAVTGSVMVRLLGAIAAPLLATGAAVLAAHNGWGLFNRIAVPSGLAVLATLLTLDFAIWLQHWASHKIPVLWRLHRMHHADTDIDVTTAIRFHPIEIGLSMLYKVVIVLALGAPPAAVIAFEVMLNAFAMFNHANVALPALGDRIVRLAIVTPDMHRVHHSIAPCEHDSNYGFNLSIWDRMFGTYTPQPAAGHQHMTLGLAAWQDERPTRIGWCLALPWQRS